MNSNIVEQILQLRRNNMGMRTISKELNISYNKVKYHCQKHNLGGFIANNPTVDNAFEMFLVNIKRIIIKKWNMCLDILIANSQS